MADSNITKQALATSLRELMKEVPFEKINVAQICERCGNECGYLCSFAYSKH